MKVMMSSPGWMIHVLSLSGRLTMKALLPSGLIIALYDTFEILAEQLLGSASLLMVSYSQGTLRLAANPKTQIATADTPLPVRSDEQEGILSLTVCIREGGGMK